MKDATQAFVEKAFWYIVGIFGSLFVSATCAVIGVLWSMNGSIVTLNERVGTVVERTVRNEEQNKLFIVEMGKFRELVADLYGRIIRVEERQPEKRRK